LFAPDYGTAHCLQSPRRYVVGLLVDSLEQDRVTARVNHTISLYPHHSRCPRASRTASDTVAYLRATTPAKHMLLSFAMGCKSLLVVSNRALQLRFKRWYWSL